MIQERFPLYSQECSGDWLVERSEREAISFFHYEPQQGGTSTDYHASHCHYGHYKVVEYDMCPTPRLEKLRRLAPRLPELVAIKSYVGERITVDIS